jgi:hypothetical protein
VNREHQRKLEAWIIEEVDALEAKGATPDVLRKEAFADLQHLLDKAQPEKLREIAAALRTRQLHDLAFGLEYLADLRESGGPL